VTAAGLTDLAGLNGVLVPQFIKAAPTCPGSGNYSAVFTANGLSVDLQCDVAGHVN